MIVVLHRDGREVARYHKARSMDDVRQYAQGLGYMGEWKGAYTITVVQEGAMPQKFFLVRRGRHATLLPQQGDTP